MKVDTWNIKDIKSLIEIKKQYIKNMDIQPYPNLVKGEISSLREEIRDLENELHIREEIKDWITNGNAIKLSNDLFMEQTTQWNKTFTESELITFYKKEFKTNY